jgi:hypothetical protein
VEKEAKRLLSALRGPGGWHDGATRDKAPDKSFLVLFFKKEHACLYDNLNFLKDHANGKCKKPAIRAAVNCRGEPCGGGGALYVGAGWVSDAGGRGQCD